MTTRYDVFVAVGFPTHTYVHRTFINPTTKRVRDPEVEITEAFNRKGIIVQVSGPSKSGKTVALQRMIPDTHFVKVPGSSLSSPDSLWRIAAAQLGLRVDKRVTAQTSRKHGREFEAEFGIDAVAISSSTKVKASSELARDVGHEHSLEDDLFTSATDELLRTNRVLFVDDFHTVPTDMKRTVASQIKAAAERHVKVCLAEVSHMADQPIESLPDLFGRVERIEFEYWSNNDLVEIARRGFERLNVTVNDSALFALADEAAGSPQLMQRLCLDLCQELGVLEQREVPERFQVRLEQLNAVFGSAIRSIDYSASIYLLETAGTDASGPPVTYFARGGHELNLNELAIAGLALTPPRIQIPFLKGDDSLLGRTRRAVSPDQSPPSSSELASVYSRMGTLSQRAVFKVPTLDFKEHCGASILDPYFLYSLRWSGRYYDIRTAVEH